jgi:hypothetical protein
VAEEASSSNNVVHLNIKPKTLNRQYKQHKFTITFEPKTKKWKWIVEVTTKMVYSDVADTQVKALRAAEKFIDRNCK